MSAKINAPLTDGELIAAYRLSRAEKTNKSIPMFTIIFTIVNIVFSLSDRYLRHMPTLSYVRIIPTLFGLLLLYLAFRKYPTQLLRNLRELWHLVILIMIYTISYMTYNTEVYKSSIPALMIGVFASAAVDISTTRRLAVVFFLPLALFIVTVLLTQDNIHRLWEMGNVFTWSVVCLVLNHERYKLSLSEFKLTLQLEATVHDLKTAQNQLIQQEKMASLGELTAGIAHEIQNPLNFVNNFAEVSVELVSELKEDIQNGRSDDILDITDALTQNLLRISQNGQRASNIVKGMLEHSRHTTGQRQLTHLNPLIDEYLRLSYQGWRGKHKTFNCHQEKHLASDLPAIAVVPQDLGRVFLNLFNNAFYAIHQKQQVASSAYQPTLTLNTTRANGHILITIRDNGTGVPEAITSKVFQPFFTTKPTGEGTGLGLSLSYEIITKGYGGNIELQTEAGEYTQFTITLPA